MNGAQQRQQLFRAAAVIETARLALDSLAESQDARTAVADALATARQIVDDVAAALAPEDA
ncbi:MAG: hypothetical protein ACREXP_19885 [Steroidobacteraceae bacterium]